MTVWDPNGSHCFVLTLHELWLRGYLLYSLKERTLEAFKMNASVIFKIIKVSSMLKRTGLRCKEKKDRGEISRKIRGGGDTWMRRFCLFG